MLERRETIQMLRNLWQDMEFCPVCPSGGMEGRVDDLLLLLLCELCRLGWMGILISRGCGCISFSSSSSSLCSSCLLAGKGHSWDRGR